LLFIDEGADFLAAVQIIVYGGAIVILFLFVIMLLGVDRREPRKQDKMRGLTPVAIVVSLVALISLLVLTQVRFWATGAKASTEALNGPGENVQKLGQSIFTAYLLPFEMTGALLVIAVVAAVVLVRRGAQSPPETQRKTAPRPPASQESHRPGTPVR
jgi:NADH-quinone oxidoreductase subunit J